MMSVYFFFACLVFVVLRFDANAEYFNNPENKISYYLHPDAGLNISQLLEKYGYPLETHVIQTEDGYLLSVHRIAHGHQDYSNSPKVPVLLVHGLMSQSTDFVNAGPGRSLSYLLADEGYDVWLLNCRGNTHSRRHITLDPDKDKSKFWDFSWHEMGKYDLPNTIDYILNATNQESLFYIGHSQGTTTFFVMASLLPEYNKKIRHASLLGPAALFSNNMDIKYRTMAKFHKELKLASLIFNVHEFLRHSEFYLDVVKTLCLEGQETYDLCKTLYTIGAGYSPTEFNMTILPVIASNSPSGFAVKQGFHYFQLFLNGGLFRQYDYGSIVNLVKYGASKPPNYNLSSISAPVTLHYAKEDQCVDYKDVEIIETLLPNGIKRMVPEIHFTHLDFLWGNNVKSLIYDYMLDEMEKYQ